MEKSTKLHVSLNGLSEHDKKISLLWVEAGTFKLGFHENLEEHEAHNFFDVTLTEGFWLSQYPITVAQWYCGLDLQHQLARIDEAFRNLPKSVNRYEAQMYCSELNRQFYTRQRELSKQLFDEGYRFTLPSEAQWEYACKAGSQTRYYNGESEEDLDKIAWYYNNSNENIHPVGEKMPNNWGFYDMLGNVSEWCMDAYAPYPEDIERINWIHTSDHIMTEFVTRGGNAEDKQYYLSSVNRDYTVPFTIVPIYGFRVCLSKVQMV